jgi:hypothetical protein
MPRAKDRTTIEVSVEVRDRLRRIADRFNTTYDRLINDLIEIAEYFSECTAEVKSSNISGTLIYLRHGGETIVLTWRDYRFLKKIVKYIPEPT